MYGVATKEDLLSVAPKNLAHLFEQGQQSSDVGSHESEDFACKTFVHQILRTGTQVSEEISYIKSRISEIDRHREVLSNFKANHRSQEEQGSLLVALGDIKNDLLAVMTDIEKEVSLLNDDQRTIKLSLEKFDTKESQEASKKLEYAQKELASFINKFVHDITFIGNDKSLFSVCTVVRHKFAESQVNLSAEYSLVFRSYIALYQSFDVWWKKNNIEDLAKFSIEKVAKAMSSLDQQILLLQQLVPTMPDAEEVINSWMKQSKEKNNMFANISFTHPDTGEAITNIIPQYAAPRQFLIRTENLLTAISKYLPANDAARPALEAAERLFKQGNDGVNKALKDMENAKMLALLQNSKSFKATTINEITKPRDLLDTTAVKSLYIQDGETRKFIEVKYDDDNVPNSLFLFRNSMMDSDLEFLLISAAIYKENYKNKHLHTMEFPNLWVQKEIPVEITDELQIDKNQLINCLMIVSPTTKWIVKFISQDALTLWDAFVRNKIVLTGSNGSLRAAAKHIKSVSFGKACEYIGGWRFNLARNWNAEPCSTATCTITKKENVVVYSGSWEYFPDIGVGHGFGSITTNGEKEQGGKSWKFIMDAVNGVIISPLERTPIQDKIIAREQLSDEDWDVIINVTLAKKVIGKKGETLFTQGDSISSLYYLKSGSAHGVIVTTVPTGTIAGVNCLFTSDSLSETTFTFEEDSVIMVINRNKLADLIASWPIQCYKLMRWISFQLFRVEKTTHQGASAVSQTVNTTLGDVLRSKTAQIAHNAKDKGPPTHADVTCKYKKSSGVLSIYSEFIGFNENTPRIGLQVHSKKVLQFEKIADMTFDVQSSKLNIIYKKKPNSKSVMSFILSQKDSQSSKENQEFANMARIFWQARITKVSATNKTNSNRSFVPKVVNVDDGPESESSDTQGIRFIHELLLLIDETIKQAERLVYREAKYHSVNITLCAGQQLLNWGSDTHVCMLSKGELQLVNSEGKTVEVVSCGERDSPIKNKIIGHDLFFSDNINHSGIIANTEAQVQLIPITFFNLYMIRYDWFPTEWYRQLSIYTTEGLRYDHMVRQKYLSLHNLL